MNMKVRFTGILLTGLMLLMLAGPARGVDTLYTCGQILLGPNCLLFSPDDYGDTLFSLTDYGSFGAGDRVQIAGDIYFGQDTLCDGSYGVIDNYVIQLCESIPGYPYQGIGVLVQSTGCVLFKPYASYMRYVLDDYAGFQVGDTVQVIGNLDMNCSSSCPEAWGCVTVQSIEATHIAGVNYEACGVLIPHDNCLVFAESGDTAELYVLNEYGEYSEYDTVCVAGYLDLVCNSECEGVLGCIMNYMINGASDTVYAPMNPTQAVMQVSPSLAPSSVLEPLNGIVLDSIPDKHTYLAAFPDTLFVNEVLIQYVGDTGVYFIHPNYLSKFPESHQISQSFPDQSAPPFVAGIEPVSYYEQPLASAVKNDDAHLLATGKGVKVAVIDDGLDFSHPMFADVDPSSGYDFIDMDDDASEVEGRLYGHGTFVAGLIRLMAPDCEIMPIRCFTGEGYGYTFAVVQGIYWAIEHDADIINMSFGMSATNYSLEQAINDALDAGIIMVSSVGNDSAYSILYPSGYENVIAVSAIGDNDVIASFSNYGEHVDVCAPGINLYSALAGIYNWGTWSGTSFAAPLVSGVCALSLERNRGTSVAGMIDNIHQTARKQMAWGNVVPVDPRYGYGALDAFTTVLSWSRGDCDISGEWDISDIVRIIAYLYLDGQLDSLGETLADYNCDGDIDISDITALIRFLYQDRVNPLPCY